MPDVQQLAPSELGSRCSRKKRGVHINPITVCVGVFAVLMCVLTLGVKRK